MRGVHTFVLMESESERVILELAAISSKRDAEEELVQESSKRQKTGESSELVEEPKDKEEEELSQERIQQMMIIVPEEGVSTVKRNSHIDVGCKALDKMADENVPAPAPIRTTDQILPFAVAFTASVSVPAIYIQQFWNTLTYVEKAGTYRFQLDENWFTLDANLLREVLEITPIDQAYLFVSPPLGDAIMNFVNKLGYPMVIHFVSSIVVNHLYQPWRAILSMINQGLISKTSGHDRPRYPVLQMLWGIITSTNVNYAELMWEEFMQAMQTFLTDKAKLGRRIYNIHQRSASPFHLAEEDLRLGNLKFVSKGEIDEVFGMPIPNELISNNIKNAPYYNAYLEMVTKHDQKVAAKKEGKKKYANAETGAGSDKTNSRGDTEILQINEELGEDVEKQVDLEEKTTELDQDQAGSDPGETYESRPPPENVLMDEDQAGPDPGIRCVALAGLDPEPTHDEFMATLYPKVQESLKFLTDEHVILEDPLSSTGTLSLMKNLKDAYAIEDQFINDKSTKYEPGKLNVEAEVVSMVTIPIYQASSSVPPLSTPVIDLLPPKPASSTTQTPIFTATTMTTTPLPPPLQQQSTTESELAERVAALEKKLFDLEQNNKNLDNTTQNLRSMVYNLELRDLPHMINEAVHENVKEAVQIALQAPLRDRFRDLSEEDMKEMLH
ncbi:hypothetical protein Tco_0264674 [Tanacetum coccineum]